MSTAVEIAARLDEATQDSRLLDHPFYKAWAEGTLTLEDLKHYSTQYWRQVEAFPGYLEELSGRIEGRPAEVLKANLADEIGGDHPGLWLDFAAAMGADADEVRNSPTELETAACIGSFAGSAKSSAPVFALGMLYGYESQTPMVAQTKVEGLRNHYGIDGPGLTYFELHGELDVEHSRELAGAIADVVTNDDDLELAAAGAQAGAMAVWGLLDGVCRARELATA